MTEYERGEMIPSMVNPGPNTDIQKYQAYLNYTEDNPASSYQFTQTNLRME